MMTSAPRPQVVGPGAMLTLRLQMNSGELLTYQWLHDGMPIAGATNATLPIPTMGMGNAGRYTVVARNSIGMVANSSAVIGMFSLTMSEGTPRLTVAAAAGTQFRLDYSDTLSSGANWQAVTNFLMTSSTAQVSDTPPAALQGRFYRAVMLP